MSSSKCLHNCMVLMCVKILLQIFHARMIPAMVTIHDCCIAGTFTAVLVEYDGDSVMKFDNGIHLENGGGMTLKEVR